MSWIRPSRHRDVVVYQSGVAVTAPADTNENVLATITIPGGMVGPNGSVRVSFHVTCTKNANAKTVRARIGGISGTIMAERTLANYPGASFTMSVANRNSESSQESSLVDGMMDLSGATFSYGKQTPTVNTANEFTIVISAQKGSAGDSMILERYTCEIFPGA